MPRQRIEALDHLRGLMALSVMAYHYGSWTFGPLESDLVLGRLGIYAVSVFYILSGVSLALVYYGRIHDGGAVLDFAIRRVFRIFPLFYLVVTAALMLAAVSSTLRHESFQFPWYAAALNYTLSFGFIDPSAYLSTGAWSIGNEMVFYAIFPLLLLVNTRAPLALPLALIASVCVELLFAFRWLIPAQSIEAQWATYINPFNQLFLFLAGVAIGAYLKPDERRRTSYRPLLACIAAVLVFAFWPAAGDHIEIATGWSRVVLSSACIVLVAGIFVLQPRAGTWMARLLGFLGEGCYSIYLLHPLVAIPIVAVFARFGVAGKGYAYATAFVATLFVSVLTFRYIEQPMMARGRRVSGMARAHA